MKYYLILLVAIIFFGCDSNKEELERLRKENAELRQVESVKNKYIEEATLALNDIYDTLRTLQTTITIYQQGVETAPPERKQQILDAIANIKNELKSYKTKLASLQEKLKQSAVKIAGLEELVEKYKKLVSEKEAEIEALNINVAQLKETISEKETEIAKKDIELEKTKLERERKDEELNTLYYLADNETNLLEKKILVKKGTWPFRTVNFSEQPEEAGFTKIDLRNKKEIIINSEYEKDFSNIKIYPNRNSALFSFEPIDNNSFKLVIKDTKSFVKISKYLVIAIE